MALDPKDRQDDMVISWIWQGDMTFIVSDIGSTNKRLGSCTQGDILLLLVLALTSSPLVKSVV